MRRYRGGVARDRTARIRSAADPILVDGERITGFGQCWAAQMKGRVPLLFRGRRQYLMALTDRRLLVFDRKRKPTPSDLVIGKRYETFKLERVRRKRPLLQVLVSAANGMRMVFEFRPGQRDIGGELVARLTPKDGRGAKPEPAAAPAPEPQPVAAAPPEPVAPETQPNVTVRDPDAPVNLAERLGLDPAPSPDPGPPLAPDQEPAPAPAPPPVPEPGAGTDPNATTPKRSGAGSSTTPAAARCRSCSRSMPARPASARSRSTSSSDPARRPTGSSRSTSRARDGSSTTPRRSGRRRSRPLSEVAATVAEAGDTVLAMGITNQRETVVAWDRRSGTPRHRAIVWQDRRTAGRCDELRQEGLEPRVRAITGLVLDPYFSGDQARVAAADGGVEADADLLVGTVDTWILWRLTGGTAGGVHATDPSNASRTMLFDIDALDWSDELLARFEVPRACLPEVGPSSGRFGITDPAPLAA